MVIPVVLLYMLCLFTLPLQAFSTDTLPRPQLEVILHKFENLVETTRRDFGIPGMAVAIIQDDKVVYSKGFGVKKVDEDEPVTPETVFQIGSTSKAFTAALVATLVDEGEVGWKDPVVKHLPDFAMADPWVTQAFQVRDLMAQHSGMKPYAGDILSVLGYGRNEIVRSTAYIKPVSSFRSEFSYVNNLWVTAAALLEKKTGKTWEHNLQDRILDPLGMNNTTCTQDGFFDSPERALPHILKKGKVVPLGRDWVFFDWPYTYGPAGGINSTVLDMAKWVRFQLGDGVFGGQKILSSRNLAYPHCPQTPMDASDSYCMGWVKSDFQPYPLIWHNGETTGSKTLVMLVPQVKLGIVILSNLGTRAPEALGRAFVDLYFGNSSGESYISRSLDTWNRSKEKKEMHDPSQNSWIPEDLSPYQGIYESEFLGRGTVIEEEGCLWLQIGPMGRRLSLNPLKKDLFACEAENLGLAGMVRFKHEGDGQVVAFDMTDEDGDHFTSFVKKNSLK
jgi:CubicO group peptidase (beta-lactamase class C family)